MSWWYHYCLNSSGQSLVLWIPVAIRLFVLLPARPPRLSVCLPACLPTCLPACLTRVPGSSLYPAIIIMGCGLSSHQNKTTTIIRCHNSWCTGDNTNNWMRSEGTLVSTHCIVPREHCAAGKRPEKNEQKPSTFFFVASARKTKQQQQQQQQQQQKQPPTNEYQYHSTSKYTALLY